MASDIITRETIVRAWHSFVRGKTGRLDIEAFAFDLEAHLEQLYHDLASGQYRHGPYRVFVRCDPKRRVIAVPSVRDQIVHHLLVQAIGPTFERRFHPHSYASRPGRGVLAAAESVHRWIRECSDDGRQRCWALRMDVASYFASVDHAMCSTLLTRRIGEPWHSLVMEIIGSYGEHRDGRRCGIPLGNLTSQLFANVYLHELDWFVAHALRVSRYARYMDDWVVVSRDRGVLEYIASRCCIFLRTALLLNVPDRKVSITPVLRGVDWLGFRIFPHHRVLRPATIRRLRQRVRECAFAYLDDGLPHDRLRAMFASYDGLLQYAFHARERDHVRMIQRFVG